MSFQLSGARQGLVKAAFVCVWACAAELWTVGAEEAKGCDSG